MPESNWQKQPTNIVYVCPGNYQFSFVRIHFLQFPTYIYRVILWKQKGCPLWHSQKKSQKSPHHLRSLLSVTCFPPTKNIQTVNTLTYECILCIQHHTTKVVVVSKESQSQPRQSLERRNLVTSCNSVPLEPWNFAKLPHPQNSERLEPCST